ncbi:MAG: putative pre-16S rRNA nuclease [Ignavibacteria bacterium]|nr:putative pre-16S rRNA nuclease [Ignavibacteria bacterium]
MTDKFLAIDFGEKRIGIAVSDENKKYSFSRDFITNDGNLFNSLIRLIKEENISRIIIGHPLNLKSEKTVQTLKTEEFSSALADNLAKQNLHPEILFYDERFSSKIAESGIMNSGIKKKKRKEKGLIDSLSAQIILQDYIDKFKTYQEHS